MKNLRRLACEFDLDQSVRKSSQVNTSARKSWSNGVNLRLLATIGVRARSDLGGRRPVCPKKLRSAPLLDCRNQLFTPSKCTKKHAFTIVERHKIVRNRNTVFRTSHRFTRSSNDRVTKQATRSSN